MNKCALILPYFGSFPNYFSLWLTSASYNSKFDFLIFTDSFPSELEIPSNVKIIKFSLDEIRAKITTILPFKFVLHNPYKLCDYRPLYGMIFEDYLVNYEFWGHCDPDVIWGDLAFFFTDKVFAEHDRVQTRGHLCFYRNTQKVNRLALTKSKTSSVIYRDVYTHRYSAHYDEGILLSNIFKENNMRCYAENNFADIAVPFKQFVTVENDELKNTIPAFLWKEGKLFGVSSTDDCHEYSYLHLQKRKMKNNLIPPPELRKTRETNMKHKSIVSLNLPLRLMNLLIMQNLHKRNLMN